MLRKTLLLLTYLLVIISIFLFACEKRQEYNPTALEIMERHYKARGGVEFLQSVKNLYRYGEIHRFPDDSTEIVGLYESWQVFPDKIRINVFFENGAYLVQGFNGTTAWQIDNNLWLRELDGEEKTALASQAANANVSTNYLDLAREGKAKIVKKAKIDREEFKYKRFHVIRFENDSLNYQDLYVAANDFLWHKKEIVVDGKLFQSRVVPHWVNNEGLLIRGKYEDYRLDGSMSYYIEISDFAYNFPADSLDPLLFIMPDGPEAGLMIDKGCERVDARPLDPKIWDKK